MKTIKQLLKEALSAPPDVPQHSGYYSSAPRSKSSLNLKTGVYIPPVSRLPTQQSLHSSPDSRAFDNEKDALDYVTSRVMNPDDKDRTHEHGMGVQYNPNTDGSFKWTATNQLSGKDFSVNPKIDGRTGAKQPNKLYDLVHNHPLTMDNEAQTRIAKYFSTADTHLPSATNGNKNFRTDKPLNMRLVYPTVKASTKGIKGWEVSDYSAGQDKVSNLRVDDSNRFKNVSLGHPTNYNVPDVEPVRTAGAPLDRETAHEFEYTGKELYAANRGKKLRECLMRVIYNKYHQ